MCRCADVEINQDICTVAYINQYENINTLRENRQQKFSVEW
jgi:hypothetical protein